VVVVPNVCPSLCRTEADSARRDRRRHDLLSDGGLLSLWVGSCPRHDESVGKRLSTPGAQAALDHDRHGDGGMVCPSPQDRVSVRIVPVRQSQARRQEGHHRGNWLHAHSDLHSHVRFAAQSATRNLSCRREVSGKGAWIPWMGPQNRTVLSCGTRRCRADGA